MLIEQVSDLRQIRSEYLKFQFRIDLRKQVVTS